MKKIHIRCLFIVTNINKEKFLGFYILSIVLLDYAQYVPFYKKRKKKEKTSFVRTTFAFLSYN